MFNLFGCSENNVLSPITRRKAYITDDTHCLLTLEFKMVVEMGVGFRLFSSSQEVFNTVFKKERMHD